MIIRTAALFAAAIWFIFYCTTESHPQLLVLIMGWAILIPIALLRAVFVSAQLAVLATTPLLIAKQFDAALAFAWYSLSVVQWFYNTARLGGQDNINLKNALLQNQMLLVACLTLTEKGDEEIDLRKEIVEQVDSLGLFCEAASNCDSLAMRYGEKKDTVHKRHWTERAINYYANVSAGSCRCKRQHKPFLHKQAALEATLAMLAFENKEAGIAERHANNAVALIADSSNEDAEVTITRLLNYSFLCKNFSHFEALAERYLGDYKRVASPKHFEVMRANIEALRALSTARHKS